MSSPTDIHDHVVLSDDKGQLYAIHPLRLHQFKILDDEKANLKKFIADNLTTTTTYKVMGVIPKDAFRE
jgi:hypothetical protein